MAYVVDRHLHPEHESHKAELLQARTQMPVKQVTERIAIDLLNVRHRLSLMGCNLHIKSQPGNGTQVIIDINSQ